MKKLKVLVNESKLLFLKIQKTKKKRRKMKQNGLSCIHFGMVGIGKANTLWLAELSYQLGFCKGRVLAGVVP